MINSFDPLAIQQTFEAPRRLTMVRKQNVGSQVKILDAASGNVVRVLGTHSRTEDVSSLAFSPDGQLVASSDSDKTIRLWQVATGRLLHTIGQSEGAWNVTFAPDSRFLMSTGSSDGIKLWEVATGRLVKTVHAATFSYDAKFTSDGTKIVAAGLRTDVSLFEIASGEVVSWPSKTYGNVSVAGAWPDHWLVAGWPGLQTWNWASGQLIAAFGRGLWVDDMQFAAATSAAGGLVAIKYQNGIVSVWDIRTGSLRGTLNWGSLPRKCVPTKQYECILEPEFLYAKISPDGQLVAGALSAGSADPTLKLWELQTGRLIHDLPSLSNSQAAANRMVFSRDGRWLFTASFDAQGQAWVRMWDTKRGQPVHTFQLRGGSQVFDASPDGRWIVADAALSDADASRVLALYKPETGALKRATSV